MKDGPHSNVEKEGWGSFAEDGQLPVGTLGSVWVLGWDLGEGLVISEENSQPQDLRVEIIDCTSKTGSSKRSLSRLVQFGHQTLSCNTQVGSTWSRHCI